MLTGSILLTDTLSCHTGTLCRKLKILTTALFSKQLPVSLLFCTIALLFLNWLFLLFENVDRYILFLCLKHSVLKGEHHVVHSILEVRQYFPSRYKCLFNSGIYPCFSYNDTLSLLKCLDMGNISLTDTLVSQIDMFCRTLRILTEMLFS
jgi:hypothetical protein